MPLSTATQAAADSLNAVQLKATAATPNRQCALPNSFPFSDVLLTNLSRQERQQSYKYDHRPRMRHCILMSRSVTVEPWNHELTRSWHRI